MNANGSHGGVGFSLAFVCLSVVFAWYLKNWCC